MERLKNKEILIGREPEKGRLMVAITINGQHKSAVLGEFKSVPDGVSRCKPSEGRAHCKLAVDDNGRMVITNLNLANYTYVNNHEITTKSVAADAQLQLGAGKYPVSLASVVDVAKKLLPEIPKEYSIRHLEKVWEEYESTTEAIQKRQQERSKMNLLPIMITAASNLIINTLRMFVDINFWLGQLISLLPLLLYLRNFLRKDTSIEDRKAATNNFIDNYVCPNPDCHHYVGAQPYKVLRQNHNCPYCHCKWTDN